MVDFAKKVKEQREWRERKHKLNCRCAAPHPKLCWHYLHESDPDFWKLPEICNCECHNKPEPTE